jgi:metal-sulfur cluster biosynthetic enzyme
MTDDNNKPLTQSSLCETTLSPPGGVRGIVPGAGVPVESTILTEAAVLDALRQVVDPELGLNIVDLGLIYHVAIEGPRVRVAMTLTSAGCPLGESIRDGAHAALLNLAGVTEAQVDLVFDPPWTPAMVNTSPRPA